MVVSVGAVLVVLTVTVSAAVAVFPAASRAVTVSTFEPARSVMFGMLHDVVPVAVPLPPRLLTQVTCVTPTLSLAVQPSASGVEVVL